MSKHVVLWGLFQQCSPLVPVATENVKPHAILCDLPYNPLFFPKETSAAQDPVLLNLLSCLVFWCLFKPAETTQSSYPFLVCVVDWRAAAFWRHAYACSSVL
jgi:hypothetical protein